MIEKVNRNTDRFMTDYEIKLTDGGQQTWLVPAPFYISNDFLSLKEVDDLDRITKKYDDKLFLGSVIGKDGEQSAKEHSRNSTIAFLRNEPDPEFDHYDDLIINKVKNINDNIFNLELTSCMNPQYTVYEKDMHFNWHPDGQFGVMDMRGLNSIPHHLEWRKLSTVIMLSDEKDYQGGDLELVTSTSPDRCVTSLRLGRGDAITFPSFLMHRVTPITLGVRKTLVYWFCGPRWR